MDIQHLTAKKAVVKKQKRFNPSVVVPSLRLATPSQRNKGSVTSLLFS